MKALITGITGFAGGHLAEHLVAQGDQVMGSARTASWPNDAPPSIRESAELASWDIGEQPEGGFLDQAQAFQPDCIFHLAGISVPGDCGGNSPTAEAIRANVAGVQNVVNLAEQLAHPPRLVFVSSCQVYAPSPEDGRPIGEDFERAPTRGYGQTKAAAEDIVLQRTQEAALDAIVLRAFNHSGPRQAPRMMLPEWASQLAKGLTGPLQVVSRDSYLDMTDVRDIVRAYRELAVHGECGEAYNVGSGVCIRSGDVLEILLRRYHADVTVEERAPGRTQLPIADTAKMRSITGWRPHIELTTTIDDTMQYWMEQYS